MALWWLMRDACRPLIGYGIEWRFIGGAVMTDKLNEYQKRLYEAQDALIQMSPSLEYIDGKIKITYHFEKCNDGKKIVYS